MNDFKQDGKPMFTSLSSPIMISKLHETVELGTYVSFFNADRLQYGRIVQSFIHSSNEAYVRLNRYMTRGELEEEKSDVQLPSPISNRYISVDELFQTSFVIDIPARKIHCIIFVFRPEQFLNDGYEGSEHVFLFEVPD